MIDMIMKRTDSNTTSPGFIGGLNDEKMQHMRLQDTGGLYVLEM